MSVSVCVELPASPEQNNPITYLVPVLQHGLVSLKAGPKVEEIDFRHVQVCADIEESWPILDWSRSCVSLEEMVRRFRFDCCLGVM